MYYAMHFFLENHLYTKGSFINDVTVSGEGVMFCNDSTEASVMKIVTRGSKIVQNCVTSFVEDP